MQDRLPFRKAMRISRSEGDADGGGGGPSTGEGITELVGGRNLWAMSVDISEIPNWFSCKGILSFYWQYWRRNSRSRYMQQHSR